MNYRKIALVTILVLGIAGVFIYFFSKNQTGEKLNVHQDAKNIEKEYEKEKQYDEKVAKWAEDLQVEDFGYIEHDHDQPNPYNNPKGIVEYVFGSALTGNADLFTSAFDYETIAGDIEKAKSIDEKSKLLRDIMNRLTQNNTLKDVSYLGEENKGDHVEVKVALTYKGEKKVKLSIDVVTYPDDDNGGTLYYVKTSTWDMIKKIEKK